MGATDPEFGGQNIVSIITAERDDDAGKVRGLNDVSLW